MPELDSGPPARLVALPFIGSLFLFSGVHLCSGFFCFFLWVGVHLFASLHHYHEKIVVRALQSSAAADSAAFAEAGGADVGSPWWCPTREF